MKTNDETRSAVAAIIAKDLSEADRTIACMQLVAEGHGASEVMAEIKAAADAIEARKNAAFRPNKSGGMHLRSAGLNMFNVLQFLDVAKSRDEIILALSERKWERRVLKVTKTSKGKTTTSEETWVVSPRLPEERHSDAEKASEEVGYLKGCKLADAPKFCDALGIDKVGICLENPKD